jgi:hypothetical protein
VRRLPRCLQTRRLCAALAAAAAPAPAPAPVAAPVVAAAAVRCGVSDGMGLALAGFRRRVLWLECTWCSMEGWTVPRHVHSSKRHSAAHSLRPSGPTHAKLDSLCCSRCADRTAFAERNIRRRGGRYDAGYRRCHQRCEPSPSARHARLSRASATAPCRSCVQPGYSIGLASYTAALHGERVSLRHREYSRRVRKGWSGLKRMCGRRACSEACEDRRSGDRARPPLWPIVRSSNGHTPITRACVRALTHRSGVVARWQLARHSRSEREGLLAGTVPWERMCQ